MNCSRQTANWSETIQPLQPPQTDIFVTVSAKSLLASEGCDRLWYPETWSKYKPHWPAHGWCLPAPWDHGVIPRLQGFIAACHRQRKPLWFVATPSHAWHLPLCTTGKRPPGHSDIETSSWWNDVKGSSAFGRRYTWEPNNPVLAFFLWVTNAFTSTCYQHKTNKTNEKSPKFNPFQQLVAHLAERTQSFLDVIKIFLGRCLQISFQQTTQGLVSSLATKGLLVFTPIQATLPTRFKKWKPRKLAKTLFPCVSDSIRATTCTAFWGGLWVSKGVKALWCFVELPKLPNFSDIHITLFWSMGKLSAQSFSAIRGPGSLQFRL